MSTVPAVMASLLAVANTIDGVTAVLGPGATDQAGDLIFIGLSDPDDDSPLTSAASGSWTWPWLGHTTVSETYDVNVVYDCTSGDTDPTASIAAAWALCDVFMTALKDDPTLDNTAELYTSGGTFEMSLASDDAGVRAVLATTFGIRALA